MAIVVAVEALGAPTARAADGPPPIPKRMFDEKTDYSKLTLDEAIAALDAGSYGGNPAALAEILRRGPDALKEAMPVVRDLQYALSNTMRMLGVLLVNRDSLDRPSRFITAFRTAAKPGPVFMPSPRGGDGNTEPLPVAIDKYLASSLAKTLRSADAKEAAAAIEIIGELRFLGLNSLYAEVGELAQNVKGVQRQQFLDVLARSPYGAIPFTSAFSSPTTRGCAKPRPNSWPRLSRSSISQITRKRSRP
jgi:hypothetical protein